MSASEGMSPEKLALAIGLFQSWPNVQRKGPGEDRNVEIFSLIDHTSTNEGHEMLAADQSANSPDICFVGDQVSAIAETPDRPFDEGGNGFAMAAENLSGPFNK